MCAARDNSLQQRIRHNMLSVLFWARSYFREN
jgi:hypothetical protein